MTIDLKVVMLGNEAVGKTSLSERFISERFNERMIYQNTIGTAFAAKQMCIDGKLLTLGVWDTAGSERYETMTKLYYRNAKAAIVCYDISNANSWNKAKYWISEVRSVEENCKIYICATKKDALRQGKRPLPGIEAAEKYATSIQAKYFMTSSKTGENVVELFEEIARDFLSDPNNSQDVDETINLKKQSKKLRCCFIN